MKFKIAAISLLLALTMVIFVSGCKKEPSSPEPVIPNNPEVKRQSVEQLSVSESLSKVISNANMWGPILKDLYGKPIADFEFTDITGKTHKISDYKGKNVMIVLWATWCLPCKQEIPHLIALRDVVSEDELAIIAISNEGEQLVAEFAENAKMDYTVAAMKKYPEPLNKLRGYPTAFFVDKAGKIKIITEGILHLGEMKAIISAD